MTTIRALRVLDVRFPTSQRLDGSDAMNPDPDYSAAYVVLETDTPGLAGHGLTFTIGRGNDICCAAIRAMEHLIVGKSLAWIAEDMGRFWRHMTSDSQLRWIGPDKGAIHLATGAIVSAAWDLWAKAEGKPVWALVADMTPEEIVKLIDFRYITDCITPDEALALLRERAQGKAERRADLEANGYPCYTTSAGWLGYGDDKLRRLVKEAIDAGFSHIKMNRHASLCRLETDQASLRRMEMGMPVRSGRRHRFTCGNGRTWCRKSKMDMSQPPSSSLWATLRQSRCFGWPTLQSAIPTAISGPPLIRISSSVGSPRITLSLSTTICRFTVWPIPEPSWSKILLPVPVPIPADWALHPPKDWRVRWPRCFRRAECRRIWRGSM